MPTVAELLRRPAPALRLLVEHDGMRGGPFAELHDPDGLLVLPAGGAPAGYQAFSGRERRSGRLALRRGVIRDPFLRRRLVVGAADAPDFVEVVLADERGRAIARWHLGDVRLLEIAGGREPTPERYDYVLLEGVVEAIEGE